MIRAMSSDNRGSEAEHANGGPATRTNAAHARERARLRAAFAADVARLRPDGITAIDVHTHLGLDVDGMTLALPDLLAGLDEAGVARACVFPLHDPERKPSYRVPNDRVLGWASESGGRLVPFCRVDPADGALAEAERALAAGARGIKLHPQSDAFCFEGDAGRVTAGLFSLAREARVPILVHTGTFVPELKPIADGLIAQALAHPEVVLILAHGAISDQAKYTAALAAHPNVLYDSSCFNALDLFELFARVPPERIVFGSDPPYATSLLGVYLLLRVAARVGLDARQIAEVMGGTTARVLAGEPLPAASPALRRRSITLAGPCGRYLVYGSMTIAGVFSGSSASARRMLELARSVTRDSNAGRLAPALERLAAVVELADQLLADPATVRSAIPLLIFANVLAATEPPPAESADLAATA
jgi:hypothetical protein